MCNVIIYINYLYMPSEAAACEMQAAHFVLMTYMDKWRQIYLFSERSFAGVLSVTTYSSVRSE